MRLHCLAKLQNSYHCFQRGMARHGIALKVSESFNESHGHALETCFESHLSYHFAFYFERVEQPPEAPH